MAGTALILASASPRRAELLKAAGIECDIRPAHIDERVLPGEDAAAYVCRVAAEKAQAVAAHVASGAVLAADTVVEVDGLILGKPADAADARRMLGLLSGRTHRVLTAVTLAIPLTGEATIPASGNPEGGKAGTRLSMDTRLATTAVEFAVLSAAEIDWYTRTGEPSDKAGAYAIQGYASRFVIRIDGSYSNVVGLPVALVYQMCTRMGLLLF